MLILDEPESHLHPQWIVEYANLIVLLQKQLGTKFFIATHSTDMVSAIRYIAEKEDCLKNVSFYLADELQNGKYSYKDLQNDIEPIFESFNKSYAKLDEYAR
ncbi:MAG: AAA family ATPase [Bacteroidales bacterium]|nr:AAA family ATPase [Bacteroidales bacterium]